MDVGSKKKDSWSSQFLVEKVYKDVALSSLSKHRGERSYLRKLRVGAMNNIDFVLETLGEESKWKRPCYSDVGQKANY